MADKLTIIKTILQIFCFIFWITGIIIVSAGIWIRIKFNNYYINNLTGGRTMILTVIIFGITWMLSGQFGYYVTILKRHILIYLYGVLLTIILVLELIGLILIYMCIESINDVLKAMKTTNVDEIFPESCCQMVFSVIKNNIDFTNIVVIGVFLFPIIGTCLLNLFVDMSNEAEIKRQLTEIRMKNPRYFRVYERNFQDA